jgi:hypothetical protein
MKCTHLPSTGMDLPLSSKMSSEGLTGLETGGEISAITLVTDLVPPAGSSRTPCCKELIKNEGAIHTLLQIRCSEIALEE